MASCPRWRSAGQVGNSFSHNMRERSPVQLRFSLTKNSGMGRARKRMRGLTESLESPRKPRRIVRNGAFTTGEHSQRHYHCILYVWGMYRRATFQAVRKASYTTRLARTRRGGHAKVACFVSRDENETPESLWSRCSSVTTRDTPHEHCVCCCWCWWPRAFASSTWQSCIRCSAFLD